MILLSGKEVSKEIRLALVPVVEELKNSGVIPTIALILAGEDEASVKYVGMKAKRCRKAGVEPIEEYLPENISEDKVLDLIKKFNKDEKVHGIMVQLPLPKHINENKVVEAIDPEKDVDGLGPTNMGRLVLGEPCFIPAGVYSVIELLDRYKIDIKGKNTVIVGMSNIIGKPLAAYLMSKGSTTIFFNGKNIEENKELIKNADILVVDIAVKNGITKDMVKEGVVIVDNGNNYDDEGVHGDVDPSIQEIASAFTPVPGGVGPLLIRLLIKNVITSAQGKKCEK
ncbi:MAG: bifunctional 5,10-methylenetetrahydrofolate dehydrogenase/5,10-methenyltetrahydrofolate cyclohydrolase [Candidatus Ranarchaeia archaeon]